MEKSRKGTKKKSKRAKKGVYRGVQPLEERDCECPVSGINFGNDEENRRWIECNGCLHWWHISCVDLTEMAEDFYCSDCQ